MKIKSQAFGLTVLIAGLALIFTGFFLFVPEDKRNDVFWLNLTVVCLVFLVESLTELGLFGINFDFKKQIAGLGIRLFYIRFYSIAAISIIIIGYSYEIGFRYQIFFQLLAPFILLIGYFFSHLSSSTAMTVQAEQEMQRKGKDEILRVLTQFEILFTSNSTKWEGEKRKIFYLKEDARYLSPTNNKSAADLDSEITSTIQQAYAIANSKNEGGIEVFSLLNKCEELLKLRKTLTQNNN
jgi:hypothetical protein